jgi:hypothetical protein
MPTLVNTTPFAADPVFLADAQGNDLAVLLAQATYAIEGVDKLNLNPVQAPIVLGGEWHGKPGLSSLRYEPQIAPSKPGTDVVLLGHAYPARTGDNQVEVVLKVGAMRKRVQVFGDRHWVDSVGNLHSPPKPFAKMPLTYERAYGGWDRSHPEIQKHRCEKRNPVGTGYCHGGAVKGLALPNLEDPDHLVSTVSDRSAPAGFGFLSADWSPRVKWAGTYDAQWLSRQMPLLPHDLDPRFYNAAHPDLISAERLQGDEPVLILNASPRGRLAFTLPGLPCPSGWVENMQGEAIPVPTFLDTILIDTDAHQVLLLWRGHIRLKGGLAGIAAMGIGVKPEPESSLVFVSTQSEEE